MNFHPKDLPIFKTYDLKNESEVSDAVTDMVNLGFNKRNEGFKVLMPKETKLAKQIGYSVTTSINYELRKKNEIRDIKYWTYHHDAEHYAIILISNKVLEELDF